MKSLFGVTPVQWFGIASGAVVASTQAAPTPWETRDTGTAPHFGGIHHPRGAAGADCLAGGDETAINRRLASGGTGAQVPLCPGATFALRAPVTYTAARQSVFTVGYPTGNTRATLVVTGSRQTAAVFGNCGTCNDISLRNVQVNGNRPALGRLDPGQALLEFGGPTSGQWIDQVHAYEPRAWSCLHVIEGNLNCAGARVSNNQFGPSGHYENFAWADGISMACTNSLVENNVITDATDGAIVLFGAPGTLVRNNVIQAHKRVLLGGVNLVDFGPYAGNDANTTVQNNTIDAAGALIKVGIALGPAVWGDDVTHRIRGARVLDNTLRGPHMGYGIAASGVTDVTVQGNRATASFGGSMGDACRRPLNAAPGPFVFDARRVQGSLQKDFVNGTLQYALCIEPGLSTLYSYAPGQLVVRQGDGVQLAGARLGLTDTTASVSDDAGRALWTRGSRASLAGAALTFTQDGQLRLGNATKFVFKLPASGPVPGAGSTLTWQNAAPYLRITTPAGNVAWASSYNFPSFKLNAGQYISRTDGRTPTYFVFEGDANLRVRRGGLAGQTLWSTSVVGEKCANECFIVHQADGNLVTYVGGEAVFATGTNGPGISAGSVALRGRAPYVSVLDGAGKSLWRDGTRT